MLNFETAATLLDTSEIATALAGLPAFADEELRSIELAALWIKPGRHFNAHYRVATAGGSTALSAFVLDGAHARRVVDKSGPHTCGGPGLDRCKRCTTAFVAPGLLLQLFPNDYRLPALPRCLSPEQVQRASGRLPVVGCRVEAYRPGMRCQIRYRMSNGSEVFGKVAVERHGRGAAFRAHERLRAALAGGDHRVRVAEPVCYVDSLGLSVARHVEGISLHDVLSAGDVADVGAIAAALADLHRLDPTISDRTHTPADELALTGAWVELACKLHPHLAAVAAKALAVVTGSRPEGGRRPQLVHRDLHDKQILLDDRQVPALLDVDTISAGDAELDLGNLCAHLQLRGIQQRDPARHLATAVGLIEAYPGVLDRARLGWYRRASLLRLAANYALRPLWRHIAEEVAATAVERSELP